MSARLDEALDNTCEEATTHAPNPYRGSVAALAASGKRPRIPAESRLWLTYRSAGRLLGVPARADRPDARSG
jgi:hypothetical protein